MKRIMFYTMTMNSGGAERVIANLSNEFVKNNDVSIVTLTSCRNDYTLDKKITFISSAKQEKNNISNRLINCIKLLKNTKKYNPDIIIAFFPTMCFIACFFKIFIRKFKNIKLIISERNNPNREYTNVVLKKMANFLYSKADVVVFQTTAAKNYFNKKVQSKGIIIPNPINDKFLNCNINLKKENVIVNIGRLEKQKNQELLIRACATIFKKNPNWKLKIYGEGSLKLQLQNLIKELKMEKNIFIMGRCNELELELPKNKIFVLSSDYEGMPNALMEALACGLTCVSTNCPCGGPNELIKDGINGYLVPVGDLERMTDAIIKAINNPLKGNKNELKKYSSSNILKKWTDLF